MPARSIAQPENADAPAVAVFVSPPVHVSAAPAVAVPPVMPTAMTAAWPVTVLPNRSSTATAGWATNAVPPVPPVGEVVNARVVAAPGTSVRSPMTAPGATPRIAAVPPRVMWPLTRGAPASGRTPRPVHVSVHAPVEAPLAAVVAVVGVIARADSVRPAHAPPLVATPPDAGFHSKPTGAVRTIVPAPTWPAEDSAITGPVRVVQAPVPPAAAVSAAIAEPPVAVVVAAAATAGASGNSAATRTATIAAHLARGAVPARRRAPAADPGSGWARSMWFRSVRGAPGPALRQVRDRPSEPCASPPGRGNAVP